MFETSTEKTILITAITLWFAHAWYLNSKLIEVHQKIDLVLNEFNGLRNYLYEIDPQFNDERESEERFLTEMDEENGDMYAGMDNSLLVRQKEKDGKRTLSTRFSS